MDAPAEAQEGRPLRIALGFLQAASTGLEWSLGPTWTCSVTLGPLLFSSLSPPTTPKPLSGTKEL